MRERTQRKSFVRFAVFLGYNRSRKITSFDRELLRDSRRESSREGVKTRKNLGHLVALAGHNSRTFLWDMLVISPGIEPGYQASETCILSIVLRDQFF